MSQDSFIHEMAVANVNTPKGENLTLFRKEGIARNAPNANAPFHVKHPDGVLEPIIDSQAGLNFLVDIDGVLALGNLSITLTATPSVGVVGDYTYVWTLESSNGPTSDPVLGVPVANVVVASNAAAETAMGMVKVVATHNVSGSVASGFYWFALDAVIP